jgi:LPXTG-motif cell wall-anchored protein
MRLNRRLRSGAVATVVMFIAIGLAAAPATAVTIDGGGSGLPDTGSSSSLIWWVIGAAIVVVLGIGLYVVSRRRGTTGADEPVSTDEPGDSAG